MDSCYQSTKLTLIKLVKGLNTRGNVFQLFCDNLNKYQSN